MREIKFRFWVDGANGEFMIYPDNRENSGFNSEGWEFYLDHEGFEIINHRGVVEPAHHVPMQYTGLKDKNGVEIYEGDIVHWLREFISPMDMRTKHKIDSNREIHQKESGEWGMGEVGNTLSKELFNVEVIGNIYENPELLEEK